MHELLLFAQVPHSRYNYILNVLTGIAAMQPVPILEKHLIFKPSTPFTGTKAAHVGAFQGVQGVQKLAALQGQAGGEMFYVQVVGDMAVDSTRGYQAPVEEDGGRQGKDAIMDEGGGDEAVDETVSDTFSSPIHTGTMAKRSA